jgi:membrane-bound lytic murein transglycosylase D
MLPRPRKTTRARRAPLTFLIAALLAGNALAESAPASAAADQQKPPPAEPSLDELYEVGKALFDQYAPAELKEQYEFPSKQQWDEFAARLQAALQNEDLTALAEYEDEARTALVAVRAFPGYEDYAVWLQERLDYIEAAKVIGAQPAPATPPPVAITPPKPKPDAPPVTPAPIPAPTLPNYALWLQRMKARPMPARADQLMPLLRSVFADEGLPPEIAWLAETESTLNPNARSPAGAKGLFQLMPETAKHLGLSTFMPDERANAEKSARAAAKYLRELHGKFGDWPLAFAAYNGGEGLVRRLLKQKNADSFAAIASSLPSETRMYVPKVCATIAVRAGVEPGELAAPTPRAG